MTSKYVFKAGDKVVCVQPKSDYGAYFDLPAETVLTVDCAGGGWVQLDAGGEHYMSSRFRLAGAGEIAAFEHSKNPGAYATVYGIEAPASAPDANPKTRFGMAKPPLALIPAPALVHMAQAFKDGAGKYGPANWRKDPVSTSTYVNAAMRHILAWFDGEQVDPVSKVHHLGHAAGCLAILMDAQACGTLLDDRPPPAPTGDLIRELTTPLA